MSILKAFKKRGRPRVLEWIFDDQSVEQDQGPCCMYRTQLLAERSWECTFYASGLFINRDPDGEGWKR
jgi:hypothetical protein